MTGVQTCALPICFPVTILEVVKNYDIDGIQGDDRLPAMPAEGGYDAYTRNAYQKEIFDKR